MHFTSVLRASLFIFGILASAVFPLRAQEESAKETPGKGMPPRTAPTEYQAHAQAGTVAIGAEFMGHSVPTPEQTVNSEDYIVVEAGLFGPSRRGSDAIARGLFAARERQEERVGERAL